MNNSPEVLIEVEDINVMMQSALRYALPRMTYITSQTADLINKNKSHLTEKTKNSMMRDIEDALSLHANKIHQCDKDIWIKLLNNLKN